MQQFIKLSLADQIAEGEINAFFFLLIIVEGKIYIAKSLEISFLVLIVFD